MIFLNIPEDCEICLESVSATIRLTVSNGKYIWRSDIKSEKRFLSNQDRNERHIRICIGYSITVEKEEIDPLSTIMMGSFLWSKYGFANTMKHG